MRVLGRSEPKHGLQAIAEFMTCIMNYEDLPIGIRNAFSLVWSQNRFKVILPEIVALNKARLSPVHFPEVKDPP
jgi:hypothetical protein